MRYCDKNWLFTARYKAHGVMLSPWGHISPISVVCKAYAEKNVARIKSDLRTKWVQGRWRYRVSTHKPLTSLSFAGPIVTSSLYINRHNFLFLRSQVSRARFTHALSAEGWRPPGGTRIVLDLTGVWSVIGARVFWTTYRALSRRFRLRPARTGFNVFGTSPRSRNLLRDEEAWPFWVSDRWMTPFDQTNRQRTH